MKGRLKLFPMMLALVLVTGCKGSSDDSAQAAPVSTPQQVAVAVVQPDPPPPAPPTVSKAAASKGDELSWFSADDYPPSALRAEEQGTVGIAWTVNAQGRAENCRVTSSSGSSALDQATCRILERRGRYSPALDAAGNPMATTRSRRVTWRLPQN